MAAIRPLAMAHVRFGAGRGETMVKGKRGVRTPRRRRGGCRPPRVRVGSVVSEFDSEKMHVPSDSFGGNSPERHVANSMRKFFTFVAAKIVLHQLEGVAPESATPMEADRPGDAQQGQAEARRSAKRIQSDYQQLLDMLQNHPMKDEQEWIQMLLQKNSMLGLRIMEVRKAYAEIDFEWDNLRKVSLSILDEGNDDMMQWWVKQQYGEGIQDEPSQEP